MANEEVGNLNVKVSMDQTGFQNGISSINTQLKVVQSSFKAASAQLGTFGNSTDQMKLKANNLSQQVELQKQKVDSLTAAFVKSAETKGADATATQNLQVKLNLAQAALSNMENELKKTNDQLKVVGWTNLSKSMDEISTKMEAVGKKMSSVGKTLTTSLTLPIVGIGIATEKTAMDFEDGMAKVSTVADTSKVSIDNLGSKILELSNKTGQAATDIQEGLYDAISSGVDTAKSMDFMTVAVKAAKGGFTDTKTSVDGLTTTLNSYGLQAEKATDISNQMMVAQNLGKTTFGEMARSIGNVVPTAASLGVKTQELFSSLATLTANGIGTSEAVTGLKEAFSNIIKPQSQAIDMAKQLGIHFNAAHLQSVGWGQFLEEVKQKTGGSTEKMAQLFGSVEALNSVLTLTSDNGMGLFKQSMDQMTSGVNYIDDAFNKVSNTSGQNFRKSMNDLKNAGIQLGEALTPMVTKIAGAIKELAERFKGLTPVQQEMVVKIGLTLAVIGPLLAVLGPLATGISIVTGAFSAVAGAIATAGGVLAIITGPIGIAIAAVTALAAAAFLIIKNWGPIKEFFQKLWVDVSNGFTTAWNSITSTVSNIIQEFSDFINTYFGNQLRSITNILKNIANIFQQEWTIIKNVVLGIVLLLIDLITGDFGKFKSDLEGILNNIKNAFGSIWTSTKTIVIEQINILKDTAILIFNAMKTAISDTITGVKDSIINGITVAIDWIKALPSQAVQWGSDFITGFKNGIMSAMNSLLDAVKSVANNIRSFLHFSTPDQGPLADYETWMPDFMAGLANGIEANKYRVVNAVRGLSTDMSIGVNASGTSGSGYASRAGLTIINKGTIVGSNGMDEFATIISRKIGGQYGLTSGGGW